MKPLQKVLVYSLSLITVQSLASSVDAPTVFIGSAKLTIKPEKVADFKKAVHEIIKPTRKESGNIVYEGYQIIDKQGNPTNRFVFHEVWKTEKAMMIDHMKNTPHMKKFFSLIGIGTEHSWVESFEVNGETVKSIN